MWEDGSDIPEESINNDTAAEVNVEMDFTHYDGPDKRKYVRVSRVLDIIADDGLQKWRELVGPEEANRRAQDAADWGSEVHDIIKRLNQGKEVNEIPDRSVEMVMRYLAWREQWVEKMLHVERVLYSQKYGFAGTADIIAILKGSKLPQIIDIKTGAIRKKKFALQISGAYKIAAKEEGIETGKGVILPLDKKDDSGEEVKAITLEDTGSQEAFLNALGVYRYMTGEKW
jgi:hypothetical protein